MLGVGLTTAYRLKMLALVGPARGLGQPLASVGGGWGPGTKAPTLALGVGAVWGGVLLGVGGGPAVLSGLDKVIPLLFVGAGLALSVAVRGLRASYFSSMWNLTPGAQHLARKAVGGRGVAAVDQGWGALAGATGAAATVSTGGAFGVAWLPVGVVGLLIAAG